MANSNAQFVSETFAEFLLDSANNGNEILAVLDDIAEGIDEGLVVVAGDELTQWGEAHESPQRRREGFDVGLVVELDARLGLVCEDSDCERATVVVDDFDGLCACRVFHFCSGCVSCLLFHATEGGMPTAHLTTPRTRYTGTRAL